MESETPSPSIHMMDTSDSNKLLISLRSCHLKIPFNENYRSQNLTATVRRDTELDGGFINDYLLDL